MDATIGQPRADLTATQADTVLQQMLRDEPYAFRFFQAVRLLERLHPDRSPVGYFVSPREEVVRFSSRTSLNFPASEIHSFVEHEAGPSGMEVNFMGLTTVNGPLPHPYAEHLLARVRAKDHAPGEFFDLFNHRFISLFYRSWKKYRFFVGYELDESRSGGNRQAGEDPITASLYSLLGLGTGGLRGRSAVPDEALPREITAGLGQLMAGLLKLLTTLKAQQVLTPHAAESGYHPSHMRLRRSSCS